MTQPSLNDGTTTVNLQAHQPLKSPRSANVVRHKIPERNGNALQFMGTNGEDLSLTCYTTVANDVVQLKTWMNAGTQLTYNDNDHTNLTVVILFVDPLEPISFQAGYREFNLTMVEVG